MTTAAVPPDRPTAMNNATGKRLLALIRDGDYAHPGEEQANELLFAGVRPDARRRVLDAGCGGAGTAAWVQARGLGAVTGVEIDAATAELARERHPEVTVVEGDLQRAGAVLAGPFDLIYSMTAVYAAPDQAAVFRELGALAAPGAELRLLEYADPSGRFADSDRRQPQLGLVAPARAARAAGGPDGRRLDLGRGPRPPPRVRALVPRTLRAASPRSAQTSPASSAASGTSSSPGSTPASWRWSVPACSAACSSAPPADPWPLSTTPVS